MDPPTKEAAPPGVLRRAVRDTCGCSLASVCALLLCVCFLWLVSLAFGFLLPEIARVPPAATAYAGAR